MEQDECHWLPLKPDAVHSPNHHGLLNTYTNSSLLHSMSLKLGLGVIQSEWTWCYSVRQIQCHCRPK